jgi:hypothetical protein
VEDKKPVRDFRDCHIRDERVHERRARLVMTALDHARPSEVDRRVVRRAIETSE